MPRIAIDLNTPAGCALVKGQWRVGDGLVPGEPNEGLVSQIEGSPARLKDYDDSKWPVCENIRQSRSKGFTFCWWRINVEIPDAVDGVSLAGSTVVFETNVDNYGEIWVNGEIDGTGTVAGNNQQQRVTIARDPAPGTKYTIAVLAANGPFGVPRGGVFMRYATLAFETSG